LRRRCSASFVAGLSESLVSQPFYIRQMVVKLAYAAMRYMGVRFNDFGTFRRANRFRLASAAPA